jgi:1-acyl-sn-glycerol-3-phosphate acyltransferase
VANHASYLDPCIVGCRMRRHFHSLAKSELFRVPGFGTLLRAVHAHPIRRQGLDRQAMRKCAELIRSGELLLLFPEGTRTRDGNLGLGKPGAAMIAVQAGAACIPAYVEGSYDVWSRARRLPRPGKLRVYFGSPFALPPRAEGMSSKEHYVLCAAEMMRRIAALRPAPAGGGETRHPSPL